MSALSLTILAGDVSRYGLYFLEAQKRLVKESLFVSIQGGESTAGPGRAATRPEVVLSLKRSSTQDRRQNETQDYSEQLRLLHSHLPAKQDTVRREAGFFSLLGGAARGSYSRWVREKG